jgi:hypothetical protein
MKLTIWLLAVVVSAAQFGVALAALPRLINKTITISWTEAVQQKAPDGRFLNNQVTRQRTVYVSSAGRIFVRSNNRSKGGELNRERGPGYTAVGTLNFQGNLLVGYDVNEGNARKLSVKFDSSFSSCTATIVWGKSGGTPRWLGYDGVIYKILSVSVTGSNCSIREGNAFAS